MIEKNNYEIKIIDAPAENFSFEKTVKEILRFCPDIIGIYTNISNFKVAEKLFSAIKRINKKVITVVGGPFASSNIEMIKNIDIDYLVCGEGEYAFLELIKNLEVNKKYEKINGVAFYKNGKVVFKRPKFIKNLDELPVRAWHLLPIKKYRPSPVSYKKLPAISTITSRGCPFKCIYCDKNIFGHIYRASSIERVVKELTVLKGYGFKDINFWDDNFTLNKDRTEKLVERINDCDLIWNCSTRVNLVNKKMLEILSKNGCYEIGYGIESGSVRILKYMRKGITIKQIKKAVQLTKKAGMGVKLYFMIGFPDETEKDIQKTLNLAKELNPDYVHFGILTPLPGTEIYEMVSNSIPEYEYDYYSMNFSINKNFTFEELKELLFKAYKEFYLRQKYILKMFLKIHSFEDIRRYYLGVKSIILENL